MWSSCYSTICEEVVLWCLEFSSVENERFGRTKLQLIQSYCLPILIYCFGAVAISNSILNDLSVCWNNAFRKVFQYSAWESVKELQKFCAFIWFTEIQVLVVHQIETTVSIVVP